jgi:uncharacterized protein YxjI
MSHVAKTLAEAQTNCSPKPLTDGGIQDFWVETAAARDELTSFRGNLLNILKRLFLRTARPFHAIVYDNPIPKPLLRLERPFRFIFHRLDVSAADGTAMGSIEREWSWLRRIYSIKDARGREVAKLFGPILKPWTFEIQLDGVQKGTLQKRWTGFTSEFLTDADNFAIDLHDISDPTTRALCFAATVLVDVVHFEAAKH